MACYRSGCHRVDYVHVIIPVVGAIFSDDGKSSRLICSCRLEIHTIVMLLPLVTLRSIKSYVFPSRPSE